MPKDEIKLCQFCGKPMSLYWHKELGDAIACAAEIRRKKVEGRNAE